MEMLFFATMLIVGILIGKENLAPRWIIDRSDKTLGLVIYILIFLIGIEIGGYKNLLSNFGSIGLKSTILALFSTFFSAYLSKLLNERRAKNES